ncbi:Asp23/Gls24 family envelope stress response protein [Kineosporia succinea]|uniref:Alkaline shock family protein YloU n=1 Tax=Kineosporia succinea TaxID=84632 RepID=A0ABT9P9X5_9ACTN|nr:Asp23/Gls24 family envelope stress response protein [Kineosporia succinea]MDP9829498.1 putative alkaline shock family protein YloU [Kineosporia succinea]
MAQTLESSSNNSPSSTSGTTPGVSTETALVTKQGRTSIADTVVAKIAGIAAREVSGVHSLGGGAARAVGALRERIPGSRTNHSQGVSVEVGEREAAVDIQLVAEYGVSIADLAGGIRRNVIGSLEGMTGLHVTEVNIEVQDIYLPQDDDDQDTPAVSRVQ